MDAVGPHSTISNGRNLIGLHAGQSSSADSISSKLSQSIMQKEGEDGQNMQRILHEIEEQL